MINRLKALVPPRLRWVLSRWRRNDIHPEANIAHGQEGEDLALLRQIGHRSSGFYVDVGAHHPSRFSNTLAFSNLGWRGINIEANPDAAEAFKRQRPCDINLNLGIGAARGRLKFHRFIEPALNTFSPEVAASREKGGFSLKDTVEIEICPLSEVLDQHLPKGCRIDFLTVDVEGMDLEVLASNDWDKYRPGFVIAEILDCPLHQVWEHPICLFLRERGYAPVIKTGHSVIFETLPGKDA